MTMPASNVNKSLVSKEEQMLKLHFGKKIMSLAGDEFEDSIPENQIFAEIFLEFDENGVSKTNDAFDTGDFRLSEDSLSKVLVNTSYESGISASLSLEESTENAFKHEKMNLEHGQECPKSSFSYWAKSDVHKINLKQMNLSFSQHLSFKDSAQRCNSVCQIKPCHIVESFDQSIKSSYYVFDSVDVFCDLSDERQSTQKHNGNTNANLNSSPCPQEDHAPTKLMPVTPVTTKELPLPLTYMNIKKTLLNTPNSKTVDVGGNRALPTDLSTSLRSHAHHLLMDAGWKICIHSRKDGRKFDLIYYPPAEGAQLYSLSRAWISCGVKLSANTSNIREEESGRVWTDINAFSGDLADVLEFIKMEIRHPENSLSLLQRWVLLDPFVAVVCINKKISALRKGTAVKAVNSMTTVLGGTESLGLLRSDVNGVQHNSRSLCSSERSLLSDIVSDGKSSALGCPAPDLRDKRNRHRVRQEHFFKASAESRSIRSLDGQKWKGCHDARDLLGRDSKASCMLHKLNLSSGVPKVIQKDSCLSSSLRLPTEAASQKNEKLFLNKILSADSPNKQTVVHPKEKRSHQDTDSLSKKAQLGRVDTQDFNAKEVTEQHRSSCSKGGHRVESSMEYPVAHENEVIDERKRTSGSYGNLSTANQSSQHQMNEQRNVLLYPPGGTLFFTMDDNQREPLLAHLVTTNANGSTNIHQQVQPLVYQANLVTGVFVVGTNNNMLYNVGFPVYQGVLNPVNQDGLGATKELATRSTENEIVQHKRKKQRISRASKCETKQAFETPFVTKAQNKKNISKTKEAKMGGQTAIANPPSQNYGEVVGFDGDEISESNSGCLKESSLEKKSCNVSEIGKKYASPTVKTSSRMIHKNTAKLGVRARRYNKDERGWPIMDLGDGGDTLMKLNQNDVLELRLSEGDSNHLGMNSQKSTCCRSSHPRNSSEKKNVQEQLLDCTESNSMLYNISISQEPHRESCLHTSVILPDGKLPFSGNNLEVSKVKRPEIFKENKQKQQSKGHANDDDLFIATIVKRKGCRSASREIISKVGSLDASEKLRSQNGDHKLFQNNAGKGGKISNVKRSIGRRTVLCRLIEMGVISVRNTFQYCELKDSTVVKDGRVTKNGILCRCCKKFFSISEFKLHAGDMLQKPCLNLFLRSGKSYVLCQLQAWSLEYKTRKDAIPVMDDEETEQNDDTCGHCGDGGELICCDNCPSSYHQACLHSKELPEDRWYCPNCICHVCGVVVNIMEAPSAMATLECSQCQHRYHEKCIKEKVTRYEEVASRTWFCGVDCQEVYLGLRSLVGVMNCVGDGFSSTVLRCNHGDKKLQSAEEIAVVAECNMKLAIALSIMEECFLPMVDLKTGIDMIPHILYNWGSKLPRLNYKGFYTAVLEKNDELISVASIRIHSVKVAEMPLIATRSEHRRRGMCRRLLAAIEEMLKSLKVEMLVLSAIPTLVETWTSVFGFKQLEDTEKWLQNIDLMSFPGTVLLKKSLYDATTKTSDTNDEVPTRPSSSGMQGMMKDGNSQEW
ncbi:increased DNA methylation 1-like isoform X1 [Musa acuminata AAA Group]|uniref:increased DNA methylation 1-like isoform X1 n=2 Tax=Musa acuminata AAA Group TaxID=214697 RepID=UPI0031D3058E